jgi:hypothetical protein
MRYYRSPLALALLLAATLTLTTYIGVKSISQTATAAPGQSWDQPNGHAVAQKAIQELQQHLNVSTNVASHTYSSYMKIADDADKFTMDVPSDWQDVDKGTWTYQGKQIGWFMAASGNLDSFNKTHSEPGVFMGVARVSAQASDLHSLATLQQLLTAEEGDFSRQCTYKGNFDYKDLFYTGHYDLYTNCIGGDHNLLVLTAMPADRTFLILLRITVTSDADLEAAAKIFETFQMLGDPAEDDHHDEDH